MIELLVGIKPSLGLALLCGFTGLYFASKGFGRDFSEEITLYGFRLSFLAPMGFFLAEKIPYHFNASYDRKVRLKTAELFGHAEAQNFFAVHVAQKVALVITSVFFFIFLYLVGDNEHSFLILGLLVSVLLYYWIDQDLDKKLKNKKRDILIDLPGFINTLALLVNAGLSFNGAVQKVVREADPARPLYKELNYLLADIGAGKPISHSYEDFAQRVKVPEITRFVSTVLQNLSRGSGDLVYILRAQAQEAWDRRKDIAKKQGEEASSKLVFPMAMVFAAVAIIVLAPAIMTMGS